MTRAHLPAATAGAVQRRLTVPLLLGLALAFCLIVLSIQSSFFVATGAPSRKLDLDANDVREIAGFQSRVQQVLQILRELELADMKTRFTAFIALLLSVGF